jgi:dTDP-4-dehydrorhamnose 3,5-epimerase-like enzyme
MKEIKLPHLIQLPKLGESAIGYITVTDSLSIPFQVKRAFWTYYTPESIVRGRHAHYETEQFLIAVSGKIIVTTETAEKNIQTFVLSEPSVGLYIPPNVWHTMQYSHSAVQLVLASTDYIAEDYIRDYEQFLEFWKINH